MGSKSYESIFSLVAIKENVVSLFNLSILGTFRYNEVCVPHLDHSENASLGLI